MARRLLLVAVSSVVLAACGGARNEPVSPPSPAPSSSAAAPTSAAAHPGRVKPGDAKMGDKTWCPVTGEDFTVEPSSPHAEYQGRTYYFCCAACTSQFQNDPQSFIQKLPR